MEDPFGKQEQVDIKIELGQQADWQAYKNIWLEALKENPEAFRSKLENAQAKTDDDWQKELTDAERFFVFAKADSSVIGIKSMICAINKKNGEWLISRVYTRPGFRGQDLAERVMGKILQKIKAKGGTKARLTVNTGPKQEPARDVYQRKFGFKNAKPWEEDLENRLFLEKDLTDAT